MLSTIVLNWNRDYLLRRCIESYLDTVGSGYELIIVDNASSDRSREYIRSLDGQGSIRAMFLDENIGGEAFNLAISLVSGDLIQFSENDQVFLPGWREHTDAAFASFDDLGQLSLFAETPTDDECWEPRPKHSSLRFSKGKILYEAQGVGTSSIIRACLFRDLGLRVKNLTYGKFKLPNDGRLSADIKAAGFWCGWSDRYYVRNVGHEVTEFMSNLEYYTQNYASRPWVGVDGWQSRIERHNARPKVTRSSMAFPDRLAVPENTPHPVDGKPARLWSMFDGFTAETEVLDFLLALTRLVKPSQVLETGTWLGWSSCAIGRGLVANGFGQLTTLEINPEAHRVALETIAHYGLGGVVDARLISSMEFEPDRQYDMAIFDSEPPLRVPEFRRFRPWLRDGAIVVFRDTVAHHQVVIDSVHALIAERAVNGTDLPSPRGIFIGRAVVVPARQSADRGRQGCGT